MLLRNGEAKLARDGARFILGQLAERKAQELKLLGGSRKKEVALVAIEIDRTEQGAPPAEFAGADVMAGGHCGGAELARGLQEIRELDRLVAHHAGDGGLAVGVALRKRPDHRIAEALLVVEHVMGNVQARRDLARIVDVAAGTARPLSVGRGAVVIKLQRHAHDVVAGALHQPRDNGGIHAAGHGDEDAGCGALAWKSEIDVHRAGAPKAMEYRRAPAGDKPWFLKVKGIQRSDLAEF